VVLTALALPAYFASRPEPLPVAAGSRAPRSEARVPAAPDGKQVAAAVPPAKQTPPPPSRTRATTAWELSDSANPAEAAGKIHELLRAEPDDKVRCEILGAASTLDPSPDLHRMFEQSAEPAQSSRVRQVALDLWLTVYPDEAATVARRFLTDPDEDVRSVAEDYFLKQKDGAK